MQSPYKISVNKQLTTEELSKDSWIVILHASRIPPHIGIMISGNYNSLTIKGHELNVSLVALLKTIQLKNIEALFIPLKKHPVFSLSYQLEIFQFHIQQFQQVNSQATCLNPVKLFLQEFYALPLIETELLYELIERLKQNNYITSAIGLNIGNKLNAQNEFTLPIYTSTELQTVIKTERDNFNKLKS